MMTTPTVTSPLILDTERLVDGIPGWSPVDQLYSLAMLVHASTDIPGDVVEVGAWCGRSTVVLAAAARETGGAQVQVVDPFPSRDDWHPNVDGTFSFTVDVDGQPVHCYSEHTVWPAAYHDQIAPIYATCRSTFDIFSRVVRERGVESQVTVHRGTSESFARQAGPGFRCRLAFVDGDHSYEAVKKDIRALRPFLSPGAWICFDDAFSSYEGVNRAITEEVIGSSFFTGARQLTRKLFVARRTRLC